MAVKLTKVPQIGYIQIKAPDGSLLTDEQNQGAYAKVYTPASPQFEKAAAERRRRQFKRVQDQGGKLTAAADEPTEDIVAFLKSVTIEFHNLEAPSGATGHIAVAEILTDPELGYIRDQIEADVKDWGAFLPQLPPPPSAGSGSMSG